MFVSTKAIVLNAIKFQDSSLIVKCYTNQGIKSYLLKGILSKNTKSKKLKVAFFQVFTLLDIVANHNNKGKLNYIKEARVYYPFHSLNTNIYKSSIVIFLAEILTNVLKEEEENIALFNYLETSFIYLETHNETKNFHLLFLLNLTKYLGFFPEKDYENAIFFNLSKGVFSKNKPLDKYIDTKNLILLKSIIGMNFDAISKLHISVALRQSFLLFIIDYFVLHLPEFRKPKSLAILQTVFK